jgi:hypothetical protein
VRTVADPGFRIAAAAAASLLVGTIARVASAQHAEVEAWSAAQSYTVRSPWGQPLVTRRRFTQTLGLGIYDLLGTDRATGPQLSLVTRLRVDSDFGQDSAERDPTQPARYVPGLAETPFDLMVGYLEAKNLAGGWLGGKLGRQYVVDALGWWSFDGGLLRVSTPAYARVEAYGGYEQRGGLRTLATSRFAADGVYRGSRDDLADDQWPSYLQTAELAPAWGAALETTDLGWLHARVGYRKVWNRDRVRVNPFSVAGAPVETFSESRVSTERAGGALWLGDARWGAVTGNAVYDLVSQIWSQRAIGVDVYATRRVTLGIAYDDYTPTFDGDSIWNWFARDAMTTLEGRGSWQVSRRLSASATTGVRQFRSADAPEDGSRRVASDALGSLAVQYGWASGTASLATVTEAGQSGHRAGADLSTTQFFAGGLYDTLLVVSLYDWRDALRAGRDATSFTYVLGGGVSPVDQTRFGVEWEHTMNRLVGHRFRLLGTLTVAVLP